MKSLFIFLLLSVSSASAQVIFSRRVYKVHGASYQQIWTWNPANGVLKALTNTPRDHYYPICDGATIKFTSPSPDDADIRGTPEKLWSLNPATGEEVVIGPLPPESDEEQSSGEPDCDVWSKAGNLEACANEESLVVSRSGQQIGSFQMEVDICPIDNKGTIGKCPTPIHSLQWTEDRKWLLVGKEGLDDGSGSRQDDYFLLNLATMKLTTVASAETAFWLPGRNQIVYLTPQDLAPLPSTHGKHNVWVQQLMLFDPAKRMSTPITSGLSDNVDLSWCKSLQ